ncbi:MAG: glycosyltransferase family 39 protein [Elusimicrobia bacterium]|nr:glycosyltransferase family 39 protein [Elusimicrobiota bacterium]
MALSDGVCVPCRDGRRLLAAALVLRVAWACWSGRLLGYRDDGLYDDGVFLEGARAFLGLNPFPIAHPPGYSLFLAPFIALGGPVLALWAQLLLSAAVPVLVYRLALTLRRERAEALAAGWLAVLHPMLVYFSARVMSEMLFSVLVCVFFLFWLKAWSNGRSRDAALAGFLGGAATLTRGVMLPFGGVLALAAFLSRREQPRWAALVAACGAAWFLALVPWTARNWAVYRRFIPVSVQGGWNLYEGQTVDPEGIRFERASAMGEEARALGLSDPFAVDAHFAQKAKAWIQGEPLEFLRLCARKAVRFWRPAPEAPHGLAVRLGAGAFAVLVFAAALLGLRPVLAAPGAWFLLAWVLHLNLLHSVFASNLRYRLPVEPVLLILAGAGLGRFLKR